MKRTAAPTAPTAPADPPPAATTPAPGEAKPGTRPGSDPEAKNDAPRAGRNGRTDDGAPHRPAAPSEIDRSTDA